MILSHKQTIVLASTNQGKIKEIQAILKKQPIIPQSEFNITEADETGTSFVENAIIKARNATLHCHLPVIADDSGLVVDALDGVPGVISARYAGKGATDQENLLKLLRAMEGIPTAQRTARFVCIMIFMRHAKDPLPIIAQGIWEGRILTTAVGANGFGYDPIFWLPEQQKTSAELPPATKNLLSHRGQALKKLTDSIQSFNS